MNLSKAQLSNYVNSLNRLSQAGREELSSQLWGVWKATEDVDMLRDAITMLMPNIADKYGNSAYAISADLWETIFKTDTGKKMKATRPTIDTNSAAESAARWATRGGADTDPQRAISHAAQVAGKMILMHARNTQTESTKAARRKGYRGGWARVPMGPNPCAFCLMLASRGFEYATKDTAEYRSSDGDKYHTDCYCEPIASFDESSSIEGYDYEEYADMYYAAREQAGGDTSAILSSMRQMYGLR